MKTNANRQPDAIQSVERIQRRLDALGGDIAHMQRLAAIGTLTAGLAHEINNLLTPAMSFTSLARQRPQDKELAQRAIRKAHGNIEQAVFIARAILDFSSHVPCETEPANVQQVFAAAIECLGRDPGKDSIAVVSRVPHDMSVCMPARLLQQVFLNLLLNSHAAMKQQGGEITLSASGQPSGRVALEFQDSGPGIPEHIAARIFQPFVTSDELRSDTASPSEAVGTGCGLGLAVSRHLIEKAGGTIEVDSQQGKGTIFRITLSQA